MYFSQICALVWHVQIINSHVINVISRFCPSQLIFFKRVVLPGFIAPFSDSLFSGCILNDQQSHLTFFFEILCFLRFLLLSFLRCLLWSIKWLLNGNVLWGHVFGPVFLIILKTFLG